MRTARPFLLVFAPFLVAAPVFAQSVSSTPTISDPQAVALLQKSLAAMTGGTAVTDVTLTGTVTVNQGTGTASGTISMVATSTGQSKITVSLPSGDWVTKADYSVDPRTSTTTGPAGVIHNAEPEELMGPSPTWFCPAIHITAASSPNYALAYRGDETSGGPTAHHISIWPVSESNFETFSYLGAGQRVLTGPRRSSPERLGEEELYLDPSTGLPRELALPVRVYRAKDGTADLTQPIFGREIVQYSAYQDVRGLQIPFEIVMSYGGILVMQIQISSVGVNTGATAE